MCLLGAGDIAPLVECLLSMHETMRSFPAAHALGVVVYVYNPSTWELEAGGSKIQGHPWLHLVSSRPAWATMTPTHKERNKTFLPRDKSLP